MLLLLGHGSARGEAAEHALREQASNLKRHLPNSSIAVATLEGEPGLEVPLRLAAGRRVIILPLLMADGWTYRERLPRDLARALHDETCRPSEMAICRPIGLAPDLASVVLSRARSAAAARLWPTARCTLLLVAHGSTRTDRTRPVMDRQAAEIRRRADFANVRTGYLEQAPSVAEALAGVVGPLLVVGMFAGGGVHATEDIERLLDGQVAERVYLGPVGTDPALSVLLAGQIDGAGPGVVVAGCLEAELAERLRQNCLASLCDDS